VTQAKRPLSGKIFSMDKQIETMQRRKVNQRPRANLYGMFNPAKKKFVSIGKQLAEERKSRQGRDTSQGRPDSAYARVSYVASAQKRKVPVIDGASRGDMRLQRQMQNYQKARVVNRNSMVDGEQIANGILVPMSAGPTKRLPSATKRAGSAFRYK
jgi:hypothetical protein